MNDRAVIVDRDGGQWRLSAPQGHVIMTGTAVEVLPVVMDLVDGGYVFSGDQCRVMLREAKNASHLPHPVQVEQSVKLDCESVIYAIAREGPSVILTAVGGPTVVLSGVGSDFFREVADRLDAMPLADANGANL